MTDAEFRQITTAKKRKVLWKWLWLYFMPEVSLIKTPKSIRRIARCGVSCVNALSSHLKVEVHREGKIFVQEYSCGKPLYDVKLQAKQTEQEQQPFSNLTILFSSPQYISTTHWLPDYENSPSWIKEFVFRSQTKEKQMATDNSELIHFTVMEVYVNSLFTSMQIVRN